MSITDGCPSDRLPPLEPGQRVAGIDWAKDDHAVAVVDGAGRRVERFTVAHTRAGLRELLRRLGRLEVGEVAERPDGQVVEALLEAGATVVVISPNQLKNLRSRYGSAGNKDGVGRTAWPTIRADTAASSASAFHRRRRQRAAGCVFSDRRCQPA